MNIRLTIFDKHHPTLKDPRVRRAMTHAVDRQAIVDALWNGRTKVPKGLQWDFFGPMLLSDWAVPAYDPAEATRLLKEAGYDGAPVPYQMLNNYYTNQLQTAQIMVEQWKAVGLNVAIEMKENWGQILGRFPGRGICENSNSSWFNDPVASLSAYAPGGQTWEAGQWENDAMIVPLTAVAAGRHRPRSARAALPPHPDHPRARGPRLQRGPPERDLHRQAARLQMAAGAVLRRRLPGVELGLKQFPVFPVCSGSRFADRAPSPGRTHDARRRFPQFPQAIRQSASGVHPQGETCEHATVSRRENRIAAPRSTARQADLGARSCLCASASSRPCSPYLNLCIETREL